MMWYGMDAMGYSVWDIVVRCVVCVLDDELTIPYLYFDY